MFYNRITSVTEYGSTRSIFYGEYGAKVHFPWGPYSICHHHSPVEVSAIWGCHSPLSVLNLGVSLTTYSVLYLGCHSPLNVSSTWRCHSPLEVSTTRGCHSPLVVPLKHITVGLPSSRLVSHITAGCIVTTLVALSFTTTLLCGHIMLGVIILSVCVEVCCISLSVYVCVSLCLSMCVLSVRLSVRLSVPTYHGRCLFTDDKALSLVGLF